MHCAGENCKGVAPPPSGGTMRCMEKPFQKEEGWEMSCMQIGEQHPCAPGSTGSYWPFLPPSFKVNGEKDGAERKEHVDWSLSCNLCCRRWLWWPCIGLATWYMQLSDFALAVVTQVTSARRFLTDTCLMELHLVITRRGRFVGCDLCRRQLDAGDISSSIPFLVPSQSSVHSPSPERYQT